MFYKASYIYAYQMIQPRTTRQLMRSKLLAARKDMRPVPINFKEKLATFNKHWSPRVIAEMNDYQFKLVKVLGDFVWHEHPDTDEVFIVLEGSLDIEFKDDKVTLMTGEMYVVPKGVEHRPVAKEECQIMLVEPRGIVNTGDAGGQLTAENDIWV